MTDQPPQRPSPSPLLIILLVLPMLGVFGALVTFIASGGLAPPNPTPPPLPTLPPSPLVGRSAPNFELATLEGGTLRLSSLRGQVVFLNFWATWCEPCVRELPAFQAFMQQQGEGGAVILAINNGETPEQISEFLAENNVSGLPVLLDSDYDVQNRYDVIVFPTTFVVDPGGVVREAHRGELTEDALNAYAEQYGAAMSADGRG